MTLIHTLCTLSLFTAFTALFTTAHAASFDCSKQPLKAVERMICNSESLSTLDEQLAATYKAANKAASQATGTDTSAQLKSSQQAWLRTTRDVCQDSTCLERTYVSRIAFLLQWNEDAPAGSKADGNYVFSHNIVFNNGKKAVSEDCLSIKSIGNAQALVNVHVEQNNGYGCSLKGKFAVNGNAYTYLPGRGDDDLKNCQVSLHVKQHQIILSASGDGCSTGCGAHANFADGASFLRTDRAKRACEAN